MKHVLLVFGFLILLSFLHINFATTFGDNVMGISSEEKSVVQFFFPQGWGFFTRNPREPNYKLYKVEDGHLRLITFKVTSAENSFGFSRKGSKIGMEMQQIKETLPKPDSWQSSKKALATMNLSGMHYQCTSPTKELLYIKEGDYILKEYHVTPWSWIKRNPQYTNTFKYIPFQLQKS